MTDHQRAAQDLELRAKADLVLVQIGFWQVDKQQQRLGKRDDRQNGEGAAPAERIGNQRAHRNAEHRSADDTEADLGDGATRVVRADNIDGGFTGQRPEHRQPQCRDQPGERHHPDIRRQRREGVGQAKHDQHRDKQLASFEAGEVRGEERPECGDGEGKQGYQQTRLRNADVEVTGDGRQQADDDELRGQHRETGGRQQKNRKQHAKLQKTTTPAIARRLTGG
ncbi:hypothetical protein D3C72_1601750 [compost metagenome]